MIAEHRPGKADTSFFRDHARRMITDHCRVTTRSNYRDIGIRMIAEHWQGARQLRG
jgi:hypothetical protein